MNALISLGFTRSLRVARLRSFANAVLSAVVMMVLVSSVLQDALARPTSKGGKSSGIQVQTFLRQLNVYSNIEFYYTNRGVDFNAGQGEDEGCFWPRGSGGSYIFGGGLWFACKKEIEGKRHQLCDIGYNPNSGAGWYIEGENSQAGLAAGTDGANISNKYISYVGPRYDGLSGAYLPGSSTVLTGPNYYSWPLWDTSATKTINHNFYFGDYISEVGNRNNKTLTKNGNPAKPVITSEEDILNFYTDNPTTNNPEFIPQTGYPFGIDVQEEIYSWSFGRYRDMIFERHKVTNSSGDSLLNCWMAPAWDPDLDAAVGGAANDANSYVSDSLVKHIIPASPSYVAQLREPYRDDPTKLNMGVQWRDFTTPPNGQQYGWIGFSFLESPVIDANGNIIANSDSVGLGGYGGPNSLFRQNQLGLVTFQDWIILNDPTTSDLRYDFVSAGTKTGWNGVYQDQRLLMATGPFTLPPGKSVETTVAITIAQANTTSYQDNFGAVLLLADFAHQVFGEVDSSVISVVVDSGKADTTWSYFLNHFVSPAPPNIPNVTTTALDQAVLVTWDNNAEKSVHNIQASPAQAKDTSLAFLGYQLWRTTRSDHDSTIRPTGTNPDILLGSWQLYNFKTDSVFDSKGHFNHFHYTRTNTTPNPIPHSYLDVGDDNHTGVLPTSGNGNLYNNVTYYYYVVAYNEYDSINNVGPLYTAIVPPKNFVTGIPNKPAYLVPFAGDSALGINDNCLAGSGVINPDSGGVQNVGLDILDTGIFAKLFTNDTINVSFQPRWTEYAESAILDQSPLLFYVDVTENKNGVQNTYKNLNSAANSTSAYYFPLTLPGTIVYHVDGTTDPDSVFATQFTTSESTFAPNQTIDQAFSVLTNVNLEQLSTWYRLSSVVPASGNHGDPNILRLSIRTNNGSDGFANQSIFDLPPDDSLPNLPVGEGSTRPSFLGALGQTSYDVTFGNLITPGPDAILLSDGSTIYPSAMPITVSLTNCPQAILQQVKDTATDMTKEQDYHFYSATGATSIGTQAPTYTDPDTMYVPNPGWYRMEAYHYTDAANFTSQHSAPSFIGQAPAGGATIDSFYFPMGAPGNVDTASGAGQPYHVVVHKLSVGGAEIIFNAPEISDLPDLGDSIAGTSGTVDHTDPHTNDFAPNDKITLSFTGMMRNLPFPGAQFKIITQGGSATSFADSNNYVDSILAQVQVVPNPYIVTQLGQTTTDNALLYFTRLPPRCTIQIYALDGTLVTTLEHIGYVSTTSTKANDPSTLITTYNYNQLADQSSVQTWNLLTSGQQRVGSQVLFARVIAKDPYSGAEVGEITTKFAVIVGLSK